MDQIKLLLFMLEKSMPAFPGMHHSITLCDQGLTLTLMLAPKNYQSIVIPVEEPSTIVSENPSLALETEYLLQEILTLVEASTKN